MHSACSLQVSGQKVGCGKFSVDFLHILKLLTSHLGDVEILRVVEWRVFFLSDIHLKIKGDGLLNT